MAEGGGVVLFFVACFFFCSALICLGVVTAASVVHRKERIGAKSMHTSELLKNGWFSAQSLHQRKKRGKKTYILQVRQV